MQKWVAKPGGNRDKAMRNIINMARRSFVETKRNRLNRRKATLSIMKNKVMLHFLPVEFFCRQAERYNSEAQDTLIYSVVFH